MQLQRLGYFIIFCQEYENDQGPCFKSLNAFENSYPP